MSDRLPYEEQLKDQLSDLPLPDENQAWEKMSLLLDEDEDRRIVPPVILRGCLGWGLLLLVLGGFLWFYFSPGKKQHPTTSLAGKEANNQNNKPAGKETSPGTSVTDRKSGSGTVPTLNHPSKSADTTFRNPENTINIAGRKGQASGAVKAKGVIIKNEMDRSTPGSEGGSLIETQVTVHKAVKPGKAGNKSPAVKYPGKEGEKAKEPFPNEIDAGKKPRITDDTVSRSTVMEQGDSEVLKKDKNNDTAVRKPISHPQVHSKVDSIQATKKIDSPVVITKTPADSLAHSKKYHFSAGIGLQQQIPLAGQASNPYNRYGRKGGLADYIPSVYLRFHHKDQWYLQTDFRYGAPQSVKSIKYDQSSVTIIDTLGGVFTMNRITTVTSLKRTFYHQVPLTFNYYVLPHLSVGTGMMYSRFFGAVSETEINKKDLQTGTETVSKKINQVPSNTDSFFTRSQVHLVLQSAYNWKRFYFGFRYTKALQPFLKYLDPNGALKEEKDQAFNVVVRFRIWNNE